MGQTYPPINFNQKHRGISVPSGHGPASNHKPGDLRYVRRATPKENGREKEIKWLTRELEKKKTGPGGGSSSTLQWRAERVNGEICRDLHPRKSRERGEVVV